MIGIQQHMFWSYVNINIRFYDISIKNFFSYVIIKEYTMIYKIKDKNEKKIFKLLVKLLIIICY